MQINTEQIIDAILKTTSRTLAAKKLGLSLFKFDKLLQAASLSYDAISKYHHHSERFVEITQEWLIDNWINSTNSLSNLSQIHSIPLSTLESHVNRFGLHKHYKYSINVDKFTNLLDEHIWYVAGLVATDGYLPKNANSVELSLTGDSELELLSAIKNYYNISAPIVKYGKSYRLRMAFDGIKQFFIDNFGIVSERKTYCCHTPQAFPNENCAKAYFLGCSDGDGCITSDGNVFELLTASADFVVGLQQIYYKYTNILIPIHNRRNKDKSYPMIYCSDKKAINLMKWMYSVKDSAFYLKRKYNMCNFS